MVQWGGGTRNLPCNARDTGVIPGPGRPHMWQDNEAHALPLLRP